MSSEIVNIDDDERGVARAQDNLFRELVPDAKSTLRRLMLNSRNEKIQRETAESVLDRAGETKKGETRAQTQIIINDSQINMLTQVAKELFDEN